MNRNLPRFISVVWSVLTEVPGWPNAPWSHRLRRLLPVLVPALGLLGILIWLNLWHLPERERHAQAAAPLLELEAEVEALGLHTSDDGARETSAKAEAARSLLVADADQRLRLFQALQEEAAAEGWIVSFQAGETPVVFDSKHYGSLSVRAVFKPKPENTRPLASLLSYLEGLSESPKRIDLIRLAIRADEQGWHSVEAGLLLAVPIPNEKMAQ